MDQADKSLKDLDILDRDPFIARRLSFPGGLRSAIGLLAMAPPDDQGGAIRPTRFGNLKENRVNRWNVRDR